jgi:hypothetical protein
MSKIITVVQRRDNLRKEFKEIGNEFRIDSRTAGHPALTVQR